MALTSGRFQGQSLRLASTVALTLALLVGLSEQNDEICDLPGLTMEYPNVKVEGTYRMKMLVNGPKQSQEGTCSIYCKEDKNLYFKDDDGREKGLTANDMTAPINIKGEDTDRLRLAVFSEPERRDADRLAPSLERLRRDAPTTN